jgi:DNA-binding CsgD family transcriptional regulator
MLLTDAQHLVELVEGPSAITHRVGALLAGAEHEVLAFDAPPYVTADASASDAERDLLTRGVRVRAIYANEVLGITPRVEYIRELVALGESARVLPTVPLKMVIIDGRDAVFPLTASAQGTRSTAALIRRSLLCDALVELFEVHWKQAAPVFATTLDSDQVHPEITPADQALLHLLHAGLKDDAIARNLDIGERTLRRRVTALNERLGASSRFQAGAQAVRRGWL